jgi:hypothetical protein
VGGTRTVFLDELLETVVGYRGRIGETQSQDLFGALSGVIAARVRRTRLPINGRYANASRGSASLRGSGRRSGTAGEMSVSVRTSSGLRAATSIEIAPPIELPIRCTGASVCSAR